LIFNPYQSLRISVIRGESVDRVTYDTSTTSGLFFVNHKGQAFFVQNKKQNTNVLDM